MSEKNSSHPNHPIHPFEPNHTSAPTSPTRRRRARGVTLLFGMLTAVTMLASIFAPTARADQPPLGPPFGPGAKPDGSVTRYVALGDSYAALGAWVENDFTGTLPQPDRSANKPTALARFACANTPGNYPSFVAQSLGAYLVDVSCGSADTDHFYGEQFPGITPPQMEALTADTDLVTISFGGNDARVAWLIYGCLFGPVTKPFKGSSCAWFLEKPHEKRFQELPGKLDRMLRDVKRLAPNAVIIMSGYMNALDPGNNCSYFRNFAPADIAYIISWEKRVNKAVADAARRNGVISVGTNMVPGHDVCAARPDRWVGALGLDTWSLPGHPTVAGQKHMSGLIVSAYQQELQRRSK